MNVSHVHDNVVSDDWVSHDWRYPGIQSTPPGNEGSETRGGAPTKSGARLPQHCSAARTPAARRLRRGSNGDLRLRRWWHELGMVGVDEAGKPVACGAPV